ncbi:flavin reductase family protein [Microvirga pakistanensis]|uniref:flavin reductase family protein n=1 Tax=Microvirga pakistanensis TaxID=1682650 RepID=UPI00106B9F52|nr:flavin reductase family protein [Microvirga pakistanensis]
MSHHLSAYKVADPMHLRQALGRFATGVTVVTTRSPSGKLEGLTANSFSSVSLDPPLVLWSLQKRAPSLESFKNSGAFAVNVLGAHQHDYCKHFATPAPDKFQNIPYEIGYGGCPILEDCIARFECSTHSVVEGGDHLIFIGRVENVVYSDGEPLIFSAGSFCVPTRFQKPDNANDIQTAGQNATMQRECCS